MPNVAHLLPTAYRKNVRVAVAAEAVRPQVVDEEDAEVRFRGRGGGRGAAEESQDEDWKDSFHCRGWR